MTQTAKDLGLIGTVNEGRYCIMASWDDVPHISAAEKKALWDTLPPHQRDARSKGIPQLGAGAIYPIAETEFLEDDFEIPPYWPRAFALDVGWNCTAALWGAWDKQSDTIHLYSCYKKGQAEPVVHSQAILSRGHWIPGCIDPAARGRGQSDGTQLLRIYRDFGLDLVPADNGVESGLLHVWNRLISGRLKVFKSLQPWLQEFRIYRRDEKGKVVKQNDHLMDTTRYLVMTGMGRALASPMDHWDERYRAQTWAHGGPNGASRITGY